MDQQAMNLLLKLPVNFVEHFEANQLISDFELVAVLQQGMVDPCAVEDGSVGRVEVLQKITRHAPLGVGLGNNAGMHARSARVVDADVGIERAAQSNFGAFQGNLHRQQFPAQKNQ